ncbi:MAG: phosphoribosylanthranilate isomerase [Oscillospiraceae bacterium]|jgi:phosphoribosylanthranilate isomerase
MAITQIYSITSPETALKCIEAGADNIGSLAGSHDPGTPHNCTIEQINAIYRAVGNRATKVLIPYVTDPAEVMRICELTSPDVCHLTLPPLHTSEEFYREFKRRFPRMLLMQAVPMTGPEALDTAVEYAKYSDWLILDSVKPGAKEIGAAGAVHDWSISRKIVDTVRRPVILAGGLGPDNVREAIETVRPFGVDSLTRTNDPATGDKDIDLVRAFCREAAASRPRS